MVIMSSKVGFIRCNIRNANITLTINNINTNMIYCSLPKRQIDNQWKCQSFVLAIK